MTLLTRILLGVLVFTVIEVLGLNYWFHHSAPAIHFSFIGQLLLFVIIYVEHFVSVLVGINVLKTGSLFSIPD